MKIKHKTADLIGVYVSSRRDYMHTKNISLNKSKEVEIMNLLNSFEQRKNCVIWIRS